MKNLILPLLCSLALSSSFAQGPFNKMYLGEAGTYDEIREIIPLPDGGIMAFGNSDNPAVPSGDGWLIRFTADQDVVFSKYIGTDSLEDAISLALASTNDAVFLGGMSNINATADDQDLFVCKVDLDGDVIWSNTYGGADFDDFYKILATPDGGALLIGASSSFTGLQRAAYVLKINGDGNIVWSKLITGNFSQYYFDGAALPGGGYVLSGSSFKAGSSFEALVTRISENGTIIWSKTYGDSLSELGYKVVPVVSGSDTSIFVSGVSTSKTVDESADAMLLKIRMNGTLVWANTYGDADYNRAQGLAYGANRLMLFGYTSEENSNIRRSMFFYVDPETGLEVGLNQSLFSPGQNNSVYSAFYWGNTSLGNTFLACGYEYNPLDINGQGWISRIDGGVASCLLNAGLSNAFNLTRTAQVFRTADLNQTLTGGSNESFDANVSDASEDAVVEGVCVHVGLASAQTQFAFGLYPNPIKGGQVLKLKIKPQADLLISIFDSKGSMVYQTRVTDQASEIALPNLKTGIYKSRISSLKNGETLLSETLVIE